VKIRLLGILSADFWRGGARFKRSVEAHMSPNPTEIRRDSI
jgi:hypothetical protein